MAKQITVCPVADLPPGAVTGAGPYAIGNIDGKYFAVTRRCRHLRADLAGGSIEDGRLVCPWHQSAYYVENGQMVRGPQQIFAKIPGRGTTFKMLTKVWPLGRGTYRCPATTSSSNNWRACAIRLSVFGTPNSDQRSRSGAAPSWPLQNSTRTSSDGASAGLYRHRTADYRDTARGDASRCLSWLVCFTLSPPTQATTSHYISARSC